MPITYACIVPSTVLTDADRIAEAVVRARDELTRYEPELAVVVLPAASGATKVGAFSPDHRISEAIVAEASKAGVPAERLMRYTLDESWFSVGEGGRVCIATCGLDPHLHFEFGRAAARVLKDDERRIAVACGVELAKDNERFDAQYRRAVSAWDVKAMVNMDAPSRRAARERAVPQTALLMGLLGSYRVQPRELGYEALPGGGHIVAAIEVPGRRSGAP